MTIEENCSCNKNNMTIVLHNKQKIITMTHIITKQAKKCKVYEQRGFKLINSTKLNYIE